MYAATARVGGALSNGSRLELLELLLQAERGVDELSTLTGMSVANTSRHLQILRASNLVSVRKEGVRSFYRARPASVPLWVAIQSFGARHVAEVKVLLDQYFDDRGALAQMPPEVLAAEVASGRIVLIDVRPAVEFAAGHIPGALSVPIERLPFELDRLREDRQVVAYCRGPYCVLAEQAVAVLSEAGLHASRLASGYVEWAASRSSHPGPDDLA